MIKFFRHIRKVMIKENRVSKYMLYAIGEIVLVMVGILLALQVSTWNQERQARNKEQILLYELNKEFKENKAQLEEVLEKHKQAMRSTVSIIAEFPINVDSLDLDSFQVKTNGFGLRHTFNPSQGIINSLVNTSSFDLISDPELRKLLVSWNDVCSDFQEEEEVAKMTLINHITPFMSRHFAWENMTDDRVDITVLESLEYENWVRMRRSNLQDILGVEGQESELNRIQYSVDRIIELSETKRE